jgi:hypothetical protein
MGRISSVAKNFPGRGDELWGKIDDVTSIDETSGAVTGGLAKVVHQLGSPRKANVYIQDAAEAVIRCAKWLVAGGKTIFAFERRVVSLRSKPWLSNVIRQYDITFRDALGRFIDIDVKRWLSFPHNPKVMAAEARKLQKDIVIKGLNPDDPLRPDAYDTLHWAFPKALKDAGREPLIKDWVRKQFDTRYVRSRFPSREAFERARTKFFEAVDRDLILFFE